MTPEAKTIDGYSSHNEALAYAFARTTGPVVELGAGWYSTPLLHGLCESTGRELFTIEAVPDFLALFRPWMRSWHHLIHDTDMVLPWGWGGDQGSIGLVFVDHDQYPGRTDAWHDGPSRGDSIRSARAAADVVVCHDTEPYASASFNPSDNARGQADALSGWKYRRDWRNVEPWTTAVSDVVDLSERV